MGNFPQDKLRVTPGGAHVTEVAKHDAHPGGEINKKESTSPAKARNLVKLPQDGPKLIVPEQYQLELIEWQHAALLHASASKVLAALEQHFHWPTMRKDVRTIVGQCSTCQVLNAKRLQAHKHYRAKGYGGPRKAWAFDYYGCAPSKDGYNNILGGIDMASSEARLFATKERSGPVTTDAILQGVILRDGVPDAIHSDHAKEFVGV